MGTVEQQKIGIYYHKLFQQMPSRNLALLGPQILLDLRPLKWDVWLVAALLQVQLSISVQVRGVLAAYLNFRVSSSVFRFPPPGLEAPTAVVTNSLHRS